MAFLHRKKQLLTVWKRESETETDAQREKRKKRAKKSDTCEESPQFSKYCRSSLDTDVCVTTAIGAGAEVGAT